MKGTHTPGGFEVAAHTTLRILIADDELNVRKTLAIGLEHDGHHVVAVSNAYDAVEQAGQTSFDLAFVDLRLGTSLGTDLIPLSIAQSPWTRIVIITAYGSIDTAIETMKRGAADYLTKPFTPEQVRTVTNRIGQLRVAALKHVDSSSGTSPTELTLDSWSLPMRQVTDLARQVAPSSTAILIRGESGTGKGVIARAIHGWSDRADKPFATVSCPTLSPHLLESELFGHTRGAFTGAVRDTPGRVASCDGGTLFLDEIGDLPVGLQPKLLRFLQSREYERVGDTTTRRANVRIVTATNVNLEDAVKAGSFREDLFFRVNVIQIDLPALR